MALFVIWVNDPDAAQCGYLGAAGGVSPFVNVGTLMANTVEGANAEIARRGFVNDTGVRPGIRTAYACHAPPSSCIADEGCV